MTPRRSWFLVAASALALAAFACSKKEEGEGGSTANKPAPAKPAHGSPVYAEFAGFEDGKRGRTMKVNLYNFGPKVATGYMIVARYYDDGGNLLKAKAGTPFEKDTDFTSLSGAKFSVDKEKWGEVTIDMLEIPDKAAKAEVRVTKVMTGTGEDWWTQDGGFTDWPKE